MAQFVTRVDADLADAVDTLVAAGVIASRSEAVRAGLEALVDKHRRRAVGEAIASGYRNKPQSQEELAGLDAATSALVAEEPW